MQDIKIQGEQIIAQTSGISVTAGGQTITAGGQSITAGGSTVTGGVQADVIRGGAVAQTIATGGTVQTSNGRVIKATVAASAQATNLTLASGSIGQEIVVINENTTGTSTIIFTGNVIAALGTTTVTISGGAGAKFVWDDQQNLWVKV
jgi:hypothetical protein